MGGKKGGRTRDFTSETQSHSHSCSFTSRPVMRGITSHMQGLKLNKSSVKGNTFDTEVAYLVCVISVISWLLNSYYLVLLLYYHYYFTSITTLLALLLYYHYYFTSITTLLVLLLYYHYYFTSITTLLVLLLYYYYYFTSITTLLVLLLYYY